MRLACLPLLLIVMTAAACGGSDDAAQQGADVAGGPAFHGELAALKDFSYDTGPLPKSGPARLSLKLAAGGGITVDARAQKQGAKLAGAKGSGKLKLDVHVKMEGNLKVETPLKNYDGPIPGLSNIDVPIGGETAFDPFLLGDAERAQVSADVPETTLPEIPLGSVPGKLVLTIASGSKITTGVRGKCLTVKDAKATYAAETTIGGTLVLKGTIKLELPKPLDKSIDLPPVTIPIPELVQPLDIGGVSIPGLADSLEGSCAPGAGAGPGGEGAGGGGEPGGGGGGGGEPQPQGTVTAEINGIPVRIAGLKLLTPTQSFAGYQLRIDLTGAGVPEGTNLHVAVTRRGVGCAFEAQDLWLRYPVSQYVAPSVATCGLSIASLPLQPGEVFEGRFDGAVQSYGGTEAPQTVKLAFKVTR